MVSYKNLLLAFFIALTSFSSIDVGLAACRRLQQLPTLPKIHTNAATIANNA
ncbi:putative structural constituent of cell wall [Corchorus capsularis]|uniref:Putative structural constituent of cell wall n=1 Tax=Corchorus capsularis TaxID=210143 RepID=A0A1R3KYB1_COCAP|nr:putative structural constituent of cell wall [Corchorus capsularis]